MTDIELFIRESAAPRGIDGDTAVAVALTEGGVTEYAAHGSFPTGDSWWSFQLHYGGPAYPQYGVPGESVMGMGGAFTELTGWQPGVEAAWRDSIRYALNRARESGWGAWYGAAAAGIGDWEGIDTSVPWDPNSETWDYEQEGGTPVPVAIYNASYPAISQNDSWSCAPTSTRWALWAYGREPTEQWMESAMLSAGIVTTEYGLMDASGAQLAGWLNQEYGPPEYGGYHAENDPTVTFDEVAREAAEGRHPLCMGGRAWCHWTGVRGFSGGLLRLANPASGYMGITQSLSREQFAHLGPFSLVRLTNPAAENQPPAPEPPPDDPFGPWRSTVGSGLLTMMSEDGTLPAQRGSTWLPLGAPSPADVETCYGQNGTLYTWLLTVGKGFKYPPA